MTLTKKALQIAGVAAFALSFAAFALSQNGSVAERLEPVGELCMAGEECAASQTTSADTGPRSGQDIYDSKCAACHATGAAGAPKFGDVAAWAPRIDKGMEALYENAWNGFKGMPAKGLCMDCTREEMNNAVDYLVENSQ